MGLFDGQHSDGIFPNTKIAKKVRGQGLRDFASNRGFEKLVLVIGHISLATGRILC